MRIAHGHAGLVNDLNALRLDLLRLNLAGLSSGVSLSSHLGIRQHVTVSTRVSFVVCISPPVSRLGFRVSGLGFSVSAFCVSGRLCVSPGRFPSFLRMQHRIASEAPALMCTAYSDLGCAAGMHVGSAHISTQTVGVGGHNSASWRLK